MVARRDAAMGDLLVLGERRAKEADVVSAAVDYVRDREGRHGSAPTRYGRLRRAVYALLRARGSEE